MKLGISVVATIILLLYLRTLDSLADVAARTSSSGDLDELRTPSPVLHAGVALLLLMGAAGLSVYKPRGMTPRGWRKQSERRTPS